MEQETLRERLKRKPDPERLAAEAGGGPGAAGRFTGNGRI